jgi:DNA-binding beta-propeller fold protein YncE
VAGRPQPPADHAQAGGVARRRIDPGQSETARTPASDDTVPNHRRTLAGGKFRSQQGKIAMKRAAAVQSMHLDDRSGPAHCTAARWRCALWGAAAAAIAAWAPAAAAEKPARSPGHKVTVTQEMIGAGIVSSGVKLPPPPPVTGSRANPVPSWGKPLPWPIVIADRRNNRLLEVTPDKRIVWEFPSPLLDIYRGNDDVYFAPGGKNLVVNEEDNYDIHLIEYATRTLLLTYGVSNERGRAPGYLNFPDDARMLANGQLAIADIRNCRIIFVDPKTEKTLVQWGTNGVCRHAPPNYFAFPNDITPLENGDYLITEIPDAWITRMDHDGRVVWSVKGPGLRYPSDAMPARDGNVIVADYSRPGGVVLFDPRTRKILWQYRVTSGEGMLDHPSLAEELPSGDILLNDDWRNRVLVIDRQTKQIIWQYGATGVTGHAPGLLWYPDGMDIDYYHDWKAALAAARG